MLTETLQRLERLDGMDSTLFGRDLLSFGRLLLDRGWIAGIGYFSRIDVEVMDDIFEEVEVTVDEAAGRYTYPHPFRRKVILSGSLHEVTRYRFQREPFFDHLATLLGIEPRFASRRRCLVEHHLWYLGDLRVGKRHAFAPVFFGRRLKDASAEQVTTALSDPAFGTGGVVLALKDPKLALPNGHQVRAVADLLVVEDGVEQFDLPVLERILASRHAAPESAKVVIECAPDGSWLRVGDRELRNIRGQQQDFVLTMVDAYNKDNRRPKVEWAFRVAGYGEGTYDLRHITRRKEFFDFFAQGGGECWIVTDPGCASSQTRKV